jgi:hypothetical protein
MKLKLVLSLAAISLATIVAAAPDTLLILTWDKPPAGVDLTKVY